MLTTTTIGDGAGTNGANANGVFTNGEESVGGNIGGEKATRTTTMIKS